METFTQTLLQNGFSVAVAAFLLLRMENELRALRGAIDRLRYCQNCCFSPIAAAGLVRNAGENFEGMTGKGGVPEKAEKGRLIVREGIKSVS
ncbi:MAG: YvrJ family protein [Synergistaceae bacterium]|jgi:hypothetical protein|nr:YvrJ family protein [Synergistaceae bacterium]